MHTTIKKTSPVSGREDGRETRARIIECAGRLFAQNGYANTTSKEICQLAHVNQSAVNYHFGGLNGLHIAVLEEVQIYLVNIDIMTRLYHSDASPRQKVERLLAFFWEDTCRRDDWHVRAWIQEILDPSPCIGQVISSKALPKFRILTQILSDYLGYDTTDPRLYSCLITLIAPFSLIFITQDNPIRQYLPVRFPQDEFLELLKKNTLAILGTLRNPDKKR